MTGPDDVQPAGADAEDRAGERAPVDEPAESDRPARTRTRPSHRVLATIVISVLVAVLGFAIVVQLHTTSSSTDKLSGLRDDDLVRILDDQNARSDRLRQQIAQLQDALAKLQASGGRDAAAQQQAAQESQALGVLLGTLPATGPGIALRITDPDHKLAAEDLLDVVAELRGAGAEAIQFGPVRVGVSSSFGGGDQPQLDGVTLTAPYTVLAIGDPTTLDTALNIPGGVAATVRAAGGVATVTQLAAVDIAATRVLPRPAYATASGR